MVEMNMGIAQKFTQICTSKISWTNSSLLL